ncbi:methyltransferase family protein [Companilactobacillus baiquanensis]|uniref:Methyltransferase family protein n=1 Tax=Companilactobacillus baiquanensis TaxID=2486005 RepID=A0ABW1UX07_9LACO|nr:DUF1295 domain-containing protein [Companilactobacillus baiquanensis]
MYGIHRKTTKAKIFLLTIQIIYLMIVYWLILGNFDNFMISNINIMISITFLRLNAMIFFWLPRGISFKEAIGNGLAFGLYYLGFPILAIFGEINIGIIIIGWLLFIIGSALNTTSELLRKPFKDDPNNKGKLYTGGLFKYAIHINYFGDVLWVTGLALTTCNWWSLLIPIFLISLFIFSYIPNDDKYLQHHYGKAFSDYQKNTKELIPFVW